MTLQEQLRWGGLWIILTSLLMNGMNIVVYLGYHNAAIQAVYAIGFTGLILSCTIIHTAQARHAGLFGVLAYLISLFSLALSNVVTFLDSGRIGRHQRSAPGISWHLASSYAYCCLWHIPRYYVVGCFYRDHRRAAQMGRHPVSPGRIPAAPCSICHGNCGAIILPFHYWWIDPVRGRAHLDRLGTLVGEGMEPSGSRAVKSRSHLGRTSHRAECTPPHRECLSEFSRRIDFGRRCYQCAGFSISDP